MGVMTNERARTLRKTATDAEQCLWQKLRRSQIAGAKFRRQQPIGLFVVDFVCFEARVVVEVDGGQHAERGPYDERRTRWLEAQGYRVLRFWNNDVLVQTDVVAEAIVEVVQSRL